jgi:hypothetical protein
MPAFQIRQRLIPYRLLGFLLYAQADELEWLETHSEDEVRLITGSASRALRMKVSALWEAIYWLRDQKLILSAEKEQKRGTVIIKLRRPTNIDGGK